MSFLSISISATKPDAYKKIQRHVYDLLNDHDDGKHHTAHRIRIFITVLILLSMLSVILESEPELETRYSQIFYWVEVGTVALFSIEYLLRVWSIPAIIQSTIRHGKRHRGESSGSHLRIRLHYMLTPMAMIDLMAILPFFLPAFVGIDFRFIRILRLVRLIRVLKLGHFSTSMSTITRVISKKRHDISIAFFIMLVLLLFTSSIMYYIEHEAQPTAFRSIPAALWWGVATLTTIGYGDIYPITALGKFCAAIVSLIGIGIVGLPSAILASGFLEEIADKKEKVLCEKCRVEIQKDIAALAAQEHLIVPHENNQTQPI